mgnify:CR=1 FL=1
MPYDIKWIEEPWIMRVTYSGYVSTDDVNSVMEICVVEAEKHQINFLVEFADFEGIDMKVWRVNQVMALMRNPNVRWFTIIGMNPAIRMLSQLAMRFNMFKSFDTEEKALEFLYKMVDVQKQEKTDTGKNL